MDSPLKYLQDWLGIGAPTQTHAQLLAQRNALPPTSPQQIALAAKEHQAFAREWTNESPLVAIPSLLAAIPGYTAAKAVGVVKSRTPASLGEIAAGYKGIGQGIVDLVANKLNS